MSGKTAIVIGATGMIGTYLTELLLKDPWFDTVRVMVRRPYPTPNTYGGRFEVKLVDFSDAESVKLALEGTDVVFSAIGTTQKNVKGDEALYRSIDFDIPAKAARFAKEAGAEKFIIVSAIGANKNSKQFYLRLKGELEEALTATGLRSVHIMQPAMLLGDRKEYRIIEKLLNGPLKLLTKLFTGSWRKYRSIHGQTVAAAMINAAKKEEPGVFRHTYDEMVKLSNT